MGKLLVMKFGGTSVGSAEAVAQAAELVRAAKKDWPAVAVIVSAMSGVTDMLLKGAQAAASGDADTFRSIAHALRAKHENAINHLVETRPDSPRSEAQWDAASPQQRISSCLTEFETLCRAVHSLGEASPRALDAIASLGERMSIHLMAARLCAIGLAAEAIEASELIVTDEVFGSANPIMDETRAKARARLFPLLQAGAAPVITGFIGATRSGAVTTLGRGGSDYSAGILGAALDADEVWIWTDVNGVMTADPRIVADAQTLPRLSYREISELAYFGAKVLHPKTIRPVIERGIDLWIKNTFNPAHPGTLIVAEDGSTAGAVKAVTAVKGQSLITIAGRGMLGVPGVAARAFGAVARLGVSVPLISQASSEQSICFSVPSAAAGTVIAGLKEEFRLELARQDIDSVASIEDTVIVTVVGAGMRHTPGIAGKVFSALGDQQINVIAIAQGSSECSISLVVEADEADEAVRAIHQLMVKV